jgi:hypothetical protein
MTDAVLGFIQTPPNQNYQNYKTVSLACDERCPRGSHPVAISHAGSLSLLDLRRCLPELAVGNFVNKDRGLRYHGRE